MTDIASTTVHQEPAPAVTCRAACGFEIVQAAATIRQDIDLGHVTNIERPRGPRWCGILYR
jgi:hypothetical protein